MPRPGEPAWTQDINTLDGDLITVEILDLPPDLIPPIIMGVFDDEETGNNAVWVRLTPQESLVLERTLRMARIVAGHSA